MLIKVCGLTRATDVAFCEALGVDLVGFIFHPGSPRQVDPAWVASVRTRCRKVAVVTAPCLDTVARLVETARVDMVQLHGPYPPEAAGILGPARTIAVLWPEAHATAETLQEAAARWAGRCAYLLLDAGRSGGGHGRPLRLPWPVSPLPVPWILAGGLGPATIAAARTLGPAGIDLNSGVESAPGIKDPAKLSAAITIARGTP